MHQKKYKSIEKNIKYASVLLSFVAVSGKFLMFVWFFESLLSHISGIIEVDVVVLQKRTY